MITAIDGKPMCASAELRHVEAAEGRAVVLHVWRDGGGEADYTLAPRRQDLPTADGGFETRWLIGDDGRRLLFDARRPASPA